MRCRSARPNSEAIISVSPEMRMAEGWAAGKAREAGDEAAGLAGGCMRRGAAGTMRSKLASQRLGQREGSRATGRAAFDLRPAP